MPIEVIAPAMEHAGVESEMGQRSKLEFADRKWRVVRRDLRLERVRRDENARRISDRRVESLIGKPGEHHGREDGDRFQSRSKTEQD